MHRPPAVSFQVGRSRWHARVLSAGVLLAAASLCALAWGSAAEFPAWAAGVQALLVLGTAASAAWAWRRSPVGALRWDGEHWLWGASEDTPPVSGLRMVFDFQRLVLVSVQCTGASPLFLWLEPVRGVPPHVWLALRRALVHSTEQGARAPSQAADPEGLLP
jgi:hypothetical protein